MNKTLALAGISALALMGLASPAFADHQDEHPVENENSVTLCHRTGAENNPYVKITVNYHAIMSPTGHDHHDLVGNGPVGDIIPPFNIKEVNYPGKNWNAVGMGIFDNDCVIPVVTVTPTPTPTETTTTPVPTVTTTTPVPTVTTTVTVPGPETTVPGPAVTHTVPGGIVVQTKAPAPGPGQRGFNAQTAAGESTAMANAAIAAGVALLAGAAGLVLYRRQSSRSH